MEKKCKKLKDDVGRDDNENNYYQYMVWDDEGEFPEPSEEICRIADKLLERH